MRFFKKIQDWILKSERIRKRILRFFTWQINPRSLGSWCVKRTKVSTFSRRINFQSGFVGSFDAPWSERSCFDLFSKETQNPFSDSFRFKNPILDFLKETHPIKFSAKILIFSQVYDVSDLQILKKVNLEVTSSSSPTFCTTGHPTLLCKGY